MKILSVRQPWAWLIVHGYKTVENRSWRTAHRGRLYIHASLTVDTAAIERTVTQCIADGEPLTAAELAEIHTTGAIIGYVTVTDCTRTPTGDDRNWHNPPSWALVLRDPIALPQPIPAKGKMGIFTLTRV
jgi:hypothetical protein